MSQEKVRQLLADLKAELARTERLDDETRALAQQLDDDIDKLLDESEPNSPELESAIALEARFAASHPVAERILRELVATLGRIGI